MLISLSILKKKYSFVGKFLTNLYIRTISSIVLVSIFVTSILYTKYIYYILLEMIYIGMLYEWYKITYKKFIYVLLGIVVITISIFCLFLLKIFIPDPNITLLYFCIIWIVDVFCFIGGKSIKGPKLAPKISPNKTWSGLFTGIFMATILISWIIYMGKYKISFIIFVLPMLSQLSDLFVSYIKRKFNVKDSGKIIPGHGGLLDRFDSLIFTSPIFLISVYENFKL